MIFYPCVRSATHLLTYRIHLIMKFAIFLTTAFVFSAFAEGTAQQISLKANHIPLSHVMKIVQQQSGYRFFLQGKAVADTRVNIELESVSLEKAMDLLLQDHNLTWFLENKTIVIGSKQASTSAITNPTAQERVVSGRVTDEQNNPLEGVTVIIKGASAKTVSDANGRYHIRIPSAPATLVFTMVGFERHEIAIGSQSEIDVMLQPLLTDLDEVVVVGYGIQRKSDLTGSVSSVDVDRLNAVPTTNVAEMLRGKAPGVQITLGNARPGGNSSILIRGRNSLSGGNNPLFIVDGAPVSNIDDINPAEIQSMEVLKDASAQAIYGARASNGVILITTKRGQEGATTINYSGNVGIQTLWKNFNLFSPEEYADMRREAYRADHPQGDFLPDELVFDDVMLRVLENKKYVDWEDLVLRDAPIQQHNLSVRGGNSKTKVAASAGYFNQQGMIPTSGFQRGNLRINLDHAVSDKLSFGTSTYLSRSKARIEQDLLTTLIIPPLAEPYDADGNLQLNIFQSEAYTNPLFNLQESDNDEVANRLLTNLFMDWEIIEGLSYRLNTNINYRNRRYGTYQSTRHRSGQSYGGQAQLSSNETFEYLIENILNYEKNFRGEHHLDFTLMQSINEINYESLGVTTRDIGNDILGYNGISQGAILFSPNRSAYKRGILSYMARARYSFMDRYLINLTGRVDGSSVFGANEKYGFFPSAAVAWKIDQEPFFNIPSFDQLKLRASYGIIGNEAISPYQTLALTGINAYYFGDGSSIVGLLPGSDDLPNANLRWEKAATLNFGLDFSLFNGYINGTFEYYNTRTSDLLVRKAVPAASGYQRVWDNLGKTENKGFEAFLNANILNKNNIKWSIDLNYSANRNQILDIFGEVDESGNPVSDLGNNWFIGEPIDVYYDYQWNGIWQLTDDIANSSQPNAEPGHPRVKDLNQDGQITATEDRMVIRRDPLWYGSISNTLVVKGFDLYGELFIRRGGMRRNPALYDFESGGQLTGLLNGIKRDYWTPENPTHAAFRPTAASGMLYRSSTAYQPASYLRLRTLTLGYTIPQRVSQRYGVNSARIYLSATNLFTEAKFQSFHPEVDPSSYPEPRTYQIGLNLSF